jgi:Asp-tRNA(Asn)/Glu-tRNA(Gln) amidotransferase B subunit
MSEQLEPTAPSVSFVTHSDIRVQGDRQREQDRADYFQDIEDRLQRSAELAEKRRPSAKREVNLIEELDSALVALEAGAQEFEQSYGKANEPLIAAKLEADRLRNELARAEATLAEIEARGDSVTRLLQSVTLAEGALNGLLRAAEEKAIRKLVTERFGWEAPMHKVTRETLKELALDISIQSLRQFAIQQHREKTSDVAALQQRMDVVGRQLAALREHLGESSQHDISVSQ